MGAVGVGSGSGGELRILNRLSVGNHSHPHVLKISLIGGCVNR